MESYQQYNMHEAKTHLSALVKKALEGEPFMIAKAGKPLVTVSSVASQDKRKRVGFMSGQIKIPNGSDKMKKQDIFMGGF